MRIRKARLVGKDSSRGGGRVSRRKSADLNRELEDAKFYLTDDERGYVLAWYGGAGVNIYNYMGGEVGYYTMGNIAGDRPSQEEAEDSIIEKIQTGDYVDLLEHGDDGYGYGLERNSRKSSARAGTPRMKLVSRNRLRTRRKAADESPKPVDENIATIYGFEEDTGNDAEFEEPTFDATGEPEMKPSSDDPVYTHEENTAPSIEEMRSGNEMREHNGPFLDEDDNTPDLTNEDGTNRTTSRRRRSNRIRVKSRENGSGRKARRKSAAAHVTWAVDPEGYGYEVLVFEGGEVVEEYQGGNSSYESTTMLEPGSSGTISAAKLREYAEQTAREFAEEYGTSDVSEDHDFEGFGFKDASRKRNSHRSSPKTASTSDSTDKPSGKPDGEDYQRRMQLGMELSDLRIEAGLIPADARWNEVYRLAENHTADEIGHRLAEDRELVGKVASRVASAQKQTKAASGTARSTQRAVPNLAGLGNAPRREEPQVAQSAVLFGG